jgi:hypothetical protein
MIQALAALLTISETLAQGCSTLTTVVCTTVVNSCPPPGTPTITVPDRIDTKRLPSEVMDLSGWKLTLPIGENRKPLEIKQPFLDDYYHPQYFYVAPDNSIVFKAPCGGVTTANSGYPRSELRERDPAKNIDIAWDASRGIHEMTNVMRVTNLPVVKPELCVSQIHDAEDDIIEILVSGF